jgi:hypothetical protein
MADGRRRLARQRARRLAARYEDRRQRVRRLPAHGALLAEPSQFEHARSAAIAAYALCGFANFGTIGIQLGGMAVLAPARLPEISRLALRAMLGGTLASWIAGAVAGAFL